MSGVPKPYKVLVVSHTFPPAGGIGGRRWAKFAKSLVSKGYQVQVIAAAMPVSEISLWSDDVHGIDVFRYRSQYPLSLRSKPKTVVHKIKYRLHLLRARVRAKGSPYDRALFDEKEFTRSFTERMNLFIPDVVLVSGPPFNLLWYVAKERARYPMSKFIADMRDPWMTGNLYGYGGLRNPARTHELKKEAGVVLAFDKIVTPWSSIMTEMARRFPHIGTKFETLDHCWDQKDIPATQVTPSPDRTLTYGGNLYKGFEFFLNTLSRLAEKHNWLVAVFSTSQADEFKSSEYFQILPSIPSRQFFNQLFKSKFALFLIPQGLKDGFPTKLLEYAACGRPIVAVGFEGSLSRLIVDKGLGIFIKIENAESQLEQVIDSNLRFSPDREWIDSHELSNVTDRLIHLIENTTQREKE